MHNFKRDILHILQIFCVLFLPSFLLSHAKKPSAAGTKKRKGPTTSVAKSLDFFVYRLASFDFDHNFDHNAKDFIWSN